jgi:hypothetical protein
MLVADDLDGEKEEADPDEFWSIDLTVPPLVNVLAFGWLEGSNFNRSIGIR